MRERIEKVLDEDVRPVLAMDGGSVELVEITEDGIVKVRFTGGCAGCPMAQQTLLGIVEKSIKSRIPEVKEVKL